MEQKDALLRRRFEFRSLVPKPHSAFAMHFFFHCYFSLGAFNFEGSCWRRSFFMVLQGGIQTRLLEEEEATETGWASVGIFFSWEQLEFPIVFLALTLSDILLLWVVAVTGMSWWTKSTCLEDRSWPLEKKLNSGLFSFLSLPWMIFLDCTWVLLQQEEIQYALLQVSEIMQNLHFASDTRRRFMSLQQRVRRMLRMLKRYDVLLPLGSTDLGFRVCHVQWVTRVMSAWTAGLLVPSFACVCLNWLLQLSGSP